MTNSADITSQNMKEARAAAISVGATVVEGVGWGVQLATDPGSFLKDAAARMRETLHQASSYEEQKERRASYAVLHAAQQHPAWSAHQSFSKRRMEELLQQLTVKALEARVNERILAIVAAGIGGSTPELATSEDLYAADWILNAKDHQLSVLRDWLPKLFGPQSLPAIYPRSFVSDVKQYPFAEVCDDKFRLAFNEATRDYFSFPVLGDSSPLFAYGVNYVVYADKRMKAGHSGGEGAVACQVWPKPLAQRIHNALVLAKSFLSFELKA